MRPACEIHDWMYGEGESLLDKTISDIVLWANCILRITEEDQWFDKARIDRATTYFKAVFYNGAAAFGRGETPKRTDLEQIEEKEDYGA